MTLVTINPHRPADASVPHLPVAAAGETPPLPALPRFRLPAIVRDMKLGHGFLVLAGSALLGSGLVACGDDDESAGGDVDRYCELVAELDEAGSAAFAELEDDESATEEDFAEAERQFLEDHAADFAQLQDVAPDEIADDIDALLTALEERAAGGEQEEVSDEVAASEERVLAFENANCGTSE